MNNAALALMAAIEPNLQFFGGAANVRKKEWPVQEELSPFVQTDFSDMQKWTTLLDQVENENEMGFRAYIEPVSELRFADAAPEKLISLFPKAPVIFVADKLALASGVILCVNGEDATATFRARVDDLWIVENNISVGNLLFEELMEQVDEDGVLIAV